MMTRRDWWLGIWVLTAALLLHTAIPRYEWRQVKLTLFLRIDRWTGEAVAGSFQGGVFKEFAPNSSAPQH
jgi:hypothetical protein